MTRDRDELIRAALAAWDDALSPPLLHLTPADRVGVVVDAVEPLIRADERQWIDTDSWRLLAMEANAKAVRLMQERDDLRAKVELLRDVLERRTALHRGEPYVLPEPVHTYDERTIRAVLDLIDGGRDEHV